MQVLRLCRKRRHLLLRFNQAEQCVVILPKLLLINLLTLYIKIFLLKQIFIKMTLIGGLYLSVVWLDRGKYEQDHFKF